ncbi:hypothetical protein JVU11DRAFT_9075 [Chiua virens]|nr:hypothetical protein JVU11DRAFT_9075 [Chiua virens]
MTTTVEVPELIQSLAELILSSQCEEAITEVATDGIQDGIQDCLDDQYLPEELSLLTLDSNHGVPLRSRRVIVSHASVFSSDDTTSLKLCSGVDLASKKAGGREGWRYNLRGNLHSLRDTMIQMTKTPEQSYERCSEQRVLQRA